MSPEVPATESAPPTPGADSPHSPAAVAAVAATRRNRINLLWEYTQAFLTVAITLACVICVVLQVNIPGPLKSAWFIIIGFYFGRTNHARPTSAP